MQLAIEASLREMNDAGAGRSGHSPETVTCADAEMQVDQQQGTRTHPEVNPEDNPEAYPDAPQPLQPPRCGIQWTAEELAAEPAQREASSRAWVSRQVAQWEKGEQGEWYTVRLPEGGVTIEAVRGCDAEAFFERLNELGATVRGHGALEQGKARAYAYAATLGGEPEPVQRRQMPDKAKAATARGAALGWAMQGAGRWAEELELMELDSDEEPLDEIKEIMEGGGPELEELERALGGGAEGSDGATPEEVGAGLLGEPEVCAAMEAVAYVPYEPSMEELELVAELAEHTDRMAELAEQEEPTPAGSEDKGVQCSSESSPSDVMASPSSGESQAKTQAKPKGRYKASNVTTPQPKRLTWADAATGEECERQMGYSKAQRARLHADPNPSQGNGVARGSSHGPSGAAGPPPKQRFKQQKAWNTRADSYSASTSEDSPSPGGGQRARRFSASSPNLSGNGQGQAQQEVRRRHTDESSLRRGGGRAYSGSSGARAAPSERSERGRRERGRRAGTQGTAAGWTWSACATIAGLAVITALAMLGAGVPSTGMTSASTQQATKWYTGAALPDASCLMMDTGEQSDEGRGSGVWAVLDRGCTHTAFYQLEAFDRATLHTPAIKGVRVGSGQRLEVKYQGTVVLELNDTSNRTVIYRRPNVLFVPGLHRNLISERQEWDLYRTRIVGEDVNVMHLSTTRWVPRSRRPGEMRPAVEVRHVSIYNRDGLYAIRGRAAAAAQGTAEAAATWRDVTSAQLDAYRKWHARMGDAHPEKMKLMADHTLGTPLQTVPVAAAARAAGVCPHCARGKMRRGHVGACAHRPTKLMEQTQIDWWGPFSVKSVPGGYVYAAVVVDVATGWVQVYLRRAHTAADAIDVLTLYEGDMGAALRCVRTDGDSNFVSDEMQMWLAGKKVTWQKSTPYVHEEMGHAERRNGMLVPIARTSLLRARMRLAHWGDAMVHAAWVLNRTPDSSHGDEVMTPYERRHGKKPDLSNARVFGAKAWAFLDKEQRQTKMDEVAVEGRWVGFATNGAHWLIYANGRHYHAAEADRHEQEHEQEQDKHAQHKHEQELSPSGRQRRPSSPAPSPSSPTPICWGRRSEG